MVFGIDQGLPSFSSAEVWGFVGENHWIKLEQQGGTGRGHSAASELVGTLYMCEQRVNRVWHEGNMEDGAGRTEFLYFQLLPDFDCWMSHCSVISGRQETHGGQCETGETAGETRDAYSGWVSMIRNTQVYICSHFGCTMLLFICFLSSSLPLRQANRSTITILLTYVVSLFAGNRVAANLSVLNSCQVPVERKSGKGNC